MRFGYRRFIGVVVLVALALNAAPAPSGAPLMQVHADFGEDPGWEGMNNRVVASDPPLVKQDFGWSKAGQIGGHVFSSTTPAFYALPIAKPLTFNDRFSASGKVAFPPSGENGAAYIGFFNQQRQEWRPWSSVALRLTSSSKRVSFGVDYMSAQWGANGFETDVVVPADGSVHEWQMSYDPDAAAPDKWTDTKLQDSLSNQRQTAKQIFEKAKAAEPDVTQEQIDRRLSAALSEGLVYFFRRQENFWTLNEDLGGAKGAIILQVDGGQVYKQFLMSDHREQPLLLDRFGIFNLQLYHGEMELYLTDLMVNGAKIDLSKDPGWEGRGNRAEFRETDFQRQDFGFSKTNWAGERSGEIGGTFYRVEPIDPLHGFYADDVGKLSLDDPISFSGNICFTRGGTDAGMFIGYFDVKSQQIEVDDPHAHLPKGNMLGINIEGPTRVGYYFSPMFATPDGASHWPGPVFLPTGERHAFSFAYDPAANNGVGQIAITLDGKSFTRKLKPKQRAAGASFDHFGLVAVRTGGKYVTLYFDDLIYTARGSIDARPVHHEQKITTVPYPKGGRKY